MGIGENGNRGGGKWEYECGAGTRMGGNGNGSDSMGVGREWEQESHYHTPLAATHLKYKTLATFRNKLKTHLFLQSYPDIVL